MRKILLALTFSLLAGPALAASCPNTTAQVKDNANVTSNMVLGDDGSGSGNCEAAVQLKQGNNTAAVTAGSALKVDGSAVTQPISAASLPLPTGASTAAGLTTINTTLGSPFQAGGSIGNTSFAATQATASSLNATVVGTGTFATQAAQSGTWNITNVSGTVSLPTGAATSANQPTAAAQASTTSGQTGLLIQCAVTTSGPSYTTAQTDPLSCDTSGNVRVTVANALTSQVQNTDGVTPQSSTTSPNGASPVNSLGYVYNGSTLDRMRTFSGLTGVAPPAGVVYLGANASGATGGKLAGLIACDSHVFKHITTATDTLAVQGVASQTIYVCGALANGAGTATAFLENTASTNANCSSSNTQIAGNITAAAASASGFYNPIWGGLKNTSGNGLCINSTGTGGVDVDVWYTQF